MGLQVQFPIQDILQVVEVDQIHLIDHQQVHLDLVVLVEEVLVEHHQLQPPEQLILEVVVVEMFQVLVKQVVLEL
jgi:hypothetical protein